MDDTDISLRSSLCSEKDLFADSPDELKHPLPLSSSNWRWFVLIPMNLLLVGYFAVYDSPQPLETAIKSTLGLNDEEYSYFYSLLAVPNIILPLIAGYIIDFMGVRPAMLGFSFLVLLGHTIFTYGSYLLSFKVMIIGRVIFALGGDPLNISQMVMVNRWFKGKELAFAISFGPLIAGGGKALNSIIVPLMYNSSNTLYIPLLFGSLLCVISALAAISVVIIDKVDQKRIQARLISSPETSTDKVNIKDIKKFGLMVWLLVVNFGLIDGLTFTLRSFVNDFYYSVYQFSNTEAGYLVSGHYLVMAIVSPVAGKLIDKYGFRASTVFYNSLLGVLGFAFFTFVPNCQNSLVTLIPLVLFGLYVGVDDVAIIPSLPLVLKEKYLGTGYGLFYMVVNLVLFILPYTCGYIKDHFASPDEGYFWVNLFLLGLAVITAIESFMILSTDFKRGRILDKFTASKTKETLVLTSEDFSDEKL